MWVRYFFGNFFISFYIYVQKLLWADRLFQSDWWSSTFSDILKTCQMYLVGLNKVLYGPRKTLDTFYVENSCNGQECRQTKKTLANVGRSTMTFFDLVLRLVRGKSDRVATAQGKQGIWKSVFPDRENTGNLLKNIKNMFLHRDFTTNTGKILRIKKK